MHHRSGKEGIHHRASDAETEKRRVSTVVVYTFFFPVRGPEESSQAILGWKKLEWPKTW